MSWFDDSSLDSWSSGGEAGQQSTVSSVGSTHSKWHSLKPSLSSTSYILQKLYYLLVVNILIVDVDGGDSCFFLLVSHVPAHSCWLVEHSKVAQLPLIGVQLGNFAQHQNSKLRGIAQRCSSSVKLAKNCDCHTTVKLWQSQKSMAWNLTPLLCSVHAPLTGLTSDSSFRYLSISASELTQKSMCG